MAKKSKSKPNAKSSTQSDAELKEFFTPKPWLSMRSAVIVMVFASLGMAVLTAAQVIPSKGVLEGILWGLLFGGLIWAIFFGNLLFNRLFRR